MNHLIVLGWTGYAALALLALTGAIGVRTQLAAGLGVIFGSLLLAVAAVALPLSGLNLNWSWAAMPVVMVISAGPAAIVVSVTPIRLACSREISPAVTRFKFIPHTGHFPALVPTKSSMGHAHRSAVDCPSLTCPLSVRFTEVKKVSAGTAKMINAPHASPSIPAIQFRIE